jgi:hypothetical protein
VALKKDCIIGVFGWADDMWDCCPDASEGGLHQLKTQYVRMVAFMASTRVPIAVATTKFWLKKMRRVRINV